MRTLGKVLQLKRSICLLHAGMVYWTDLYGYAVNKGRGEGELSKKWTEDTAINKRLGPKKWMSWRAECLFPMKRGEKGRKVMKKEGQKRGFSGWKRWKQVSGRWVWRAADCENSGGEGKTERK